MKKILLTERMGNKHKSSKAKIIQSKYFQSNESENIEWNGESCSIDKKKGFTYYRLV